jgi:hypothetical protein
MSQKRDDVGHPRLFWRQNEMWATRLFYYCSDDVLLVGPERSLTEMSIPAHLTA